MTTLYLESSAVLAWLNGEPEAKRIIELIDRAETVSTSILTPIEAKRGLLRREFLGEITQAQRNRILGLLERCLPAWELVGLAPEIQMRAGQPFPVEPVRSLDAIHLATMIELIRIHPDLKVLSLDQRVLSNLEPLGLKTAAK